MQPYTFKVVYKSGRTNPGDYLSRPPVEVKFKQQNMTEEYVNFIEANSVPKAMTLDEIIQATNDDPVLRGLREATKHNRRNSDRDQTV